MPLSEHEQRLLDEMERNLYGGDADVVTARGDRMRPNYRWLTIGAILVVVGIAVMVAAVAVQQIVIGVGGFAVAFAGILVATHRANTVAEPARPRARRSGFMDRMEKQWDDRQADQP